MRFELMTSSLPRKRSTPELHWLLNGAEDEVRTRDPQLGRLMLYQLSYFRVMCGERRIRTSEGVRQQIYSLPQLATLVSPLITNQLLWPTELYRQRLFLGLQRYIIY